MTVVDVGTVRIASQELLVGWQMRRIAETIKVLYPPTVSIRVENHPVFAALRVRIRVDDDRSGRADCDGG